MSDYEYNDEPEMDAYELHLQEEREWDNYMNAVENEMNDFMADVKNCGGHFLFDAMTVCDFEKIMTGTYQYKKKYDEEENKKHNFIPPSLDFTDLYTEKTEQEKLEEKKGWVILTHENPRCGKCRGCFRRKKGAKRGIGCKNRGKMITKPLYPELHKVKKVLPPKPKPVSEEKKVAVEKRQNYKQTGNAWGNASSRASTPKSNKPFNMADVIKQQQEETKRKREEEIQRKKEETERTKRIEEERQRREEQQRQMQERRRRQREEQNYREQQRRDRFRQRMIMRNTNGKGTGSRFSRRNLS